MALGFFGFLLFKKINNKPGTCLILSEINCRKVKIIDYEGYKMAVASLPKGTILFSPFYGQYNNTLSYHLKSDLRDFGAILNSSGLGDLNNKSYTFIYSKQSERKIDRDNSIKKGEEIGRIDSFKLKNFKDYNFVFYISQRNPNDISKFISANDMLLKMFPLK